MSTEELKILEEKVRAHLPLLPDEAELPPDAELVSLGLDSLGTVTLLLELEETFAIEIPDELLSASTFATMASLQQVVTTLQS
ncbi:phosphopantetheine-binding protein [Kribbella sp. NBC_01505]|uniref:phosphopantetheine-binding protein n=1 Tax=Kribbella sp. NBC_01505 TaxID=2903580 RepID=UPI00386FF3BB